MYHKRIVQDLCDRIMNGFDGCMIIARTYDSSFLLLFNNSLF